MGYLKENLTDRRTGRGYKKLRILGIMKICPSERHAWYETNLSFPIRKELGKIIGLRN